MSENTINRPAWIPGKLRATTCYERAKSEFIVWANGIEYLQYVANRLELQGHVKMAAVLHEQVHSDGLDAYGMLYDALKACSFIPFIGYTDKDGHFVSPLQHAMNTLVNEYLPSLEATEAHF